MPWSGGPAGSGDGPGLRAGSVGRQILSRNEVFAGNSGWEVRREGCDPVTAPGSDTRLSSGAIDTAWSRCLAAHNVFAQDGGSHRNGGLR